MNEVFDKVIGLCYTGNNYGKLVKTLDKEEFRIKLEEINKLVQNKDYKGAMNHCGQYRLASGKRMSVPYV